MSALTSWLRALVGAAVFCALALALCPEGRPKRVLRAACGVVMAAALLSPVVELDMQALPEALARYGEAARAVAEGAGEEADRLNRTIIERECAAYNWTKRTRWAFPQRTRPSRPAGARRASGTPGRAG